MIQADPHVLELVQLTDTHLFADPQGDLLGLPTLETLQEVVSLIRQQVPRIDALLATGDLSQDGSEASYRHFLHAIQRLDAAHCCWCPGNHDDLSTMAALAQSEQLCRELRLGRWRILMLNSAHPGVVYGVLAQEQLVWLEQRLAEAPEDYYVVCLHHPPVPICSQWMDLIGLHNGEVLCQILEGYPQVRALLFGHVHQDVDLWRHSLRLLAAPSTCVQFQSQSPHFQLASLAPGYRHLRLYDDGRLETHIVRLDHFDFSRLSDAGGY